MQVSDLWRKMDILQEYEAVQNNGFSGIKYVKAQHLGMFCVWWDCFSIVHFKLLTDNVRITVDIYCQQFDHLKSEKRKELQFNQS